MEEIQIYHTKEDNSFNLSEYCFSRWYSYNLSQWGSYEDPLIFVLLYKNNANEERLHCFFKSNYQCTV